MEYRINSPKKGTGLLGRYRAAEARDILWMIDNRSWQTLIEACDEEGISISRYSDWHENRSQIDRLAREEEQSQFVRLSEGIDSVRNGKRTRFREILQLSLGLNGERQSYGIDDIADRLEIPGRVARVRAGYAESELLEKLGILRPRDPVNVVRRTMNAAKRRGHQKRKPARPMEQADLDTVQHHVRALKQHRDYGDQMRTLERRWALSGQKQQHVEEIARHDGVSPPTVEWREQRGTFAVHRHALLTNIDIPEDVRLWAALVYQALEMKASEHKRLLARVLDAGEPWQTPAAVRQLQQDERDLLYAITGMQDGRPHTADEIATGTPGVSANAMQVKVNRTIGWLADSRGVPPYEVPWLNALADGIFDQKPQAAAAVLSAGDLQALEGALQRIGEAEPAWEPCVRALRLRSGLADGTLHTTREIEEQTGIRKSKFSAKMRVFLRILELYSE